MPNILGTVAHRPFPMPARPWTMAQRWNDLLFAHWPIPLAVTQALVPPSLEVDSFDGSAWASVVPFWMDNIRTRIPGQQTNKFSLAIPFVDAFPELNLRTYVLSRKTGRPGVFFFSLDAGSSLAVLGARTLFHLPYFRASMARSTSPTDGSVEYRSRRTLPHRSVQFEASYRSLGRRISPGPSQPGSLEYFLTERYCLYTTFAGRVLVGNIHHLPWTLEAAEAEIRINELPRAHGLTLPDRPPILHFSRTLDVYVWSLEPDGTQ